MRYYYREQHCGRSVYHWHRSCVLVPQNPHEHFGWTTTSAVPEDRAGCRMCADLDEDGVLDPKARELLATTSSVPIPTQRRSQSV